MTVAGLPDLRIEGTLSGPANGTIGQALSYTGQVCNRGGGPTSGVITIAARVRTNGTPQPTDSPRTTVQGPIAQNTCVTTGPIQVTPNAAGTMTVQFEADPLETIVEVNENDNTGTALNVTIVALPDLTVRAGSIRESSPGIFEATVCNSGAAPVTQNFEVEFLGTRANGTSIADNITFETPIPLNPGVCGPITNGGFPVNGRMQITADRTSLIAESNETNNVRSNP